MLGLQRLRSSEQGPSGKVRRLVAADDMESDIELGGGGSLLVITMISSSVTRPMTVQSKEQMVMLKVL